MALLQISEPGASPQPNARRHVVGIDLGTTHSLVAAVRNGVAECLPDAEGRVLLPSAVRYLDDGTAVVGAAALDDVARDPRNTIVSVKRLMGRGIEDVRRSAPLPYDFDESAPGMVKLRTAAGTKSPVEVSAEILAALRRRAEEAFDAELDGAVVTVPAYFDDAQRQATKDAAELAGIRVLRLVNEPTAASIAYGLDNASEGLYAVYDLGGGTFDVSLLRMTRGVFEVVATGGDTMLGGDDIDAALAVHVIARVAAARASDAGGEPRTPGRTAEMRAPGVAGDRRAPGVDGECDARELSPNDRSAATVAARTVKEALSKDDRATFACRLGDRKIELPVERGEVETVARPLVDRTIAVARQVLRDAKVDKASIDGIVLVGGATRMPLVRQAVRAFFGREPLVNLDPDQVVALGAARQAEALAGNHGGADLLLLDVTPLSLGLETMGGLVERIIPRNTPIPATQAQDFTTYQDGQTAMSIHVVQGERDLVADCRSLARFELRGIPPMVAGAARIRVTFTVDADGLLGVRAREQTSGVEASVAVKPSYGLSDDEIARMLSESFGAAETDMAARALREAQVDADRLLGATASALAADADLLDAGDRAAIDAAVADLRAARAGDDRGGIESALEGLSAATEAFAAERMNRGIRRALAGKRIGDL